MVVVPVEIHSTYTKSTAHLPNIIIWRLAVSVLDGQRSPSCTARGRLCHSADEAQTWAIG